MTNMKKLFKLAYEKYPETPGGYFDGEMMDGNSSARHAYIRGFEDAINYIKTNGMDKLEEFLDNE